MPHPDPHADPLAFIAHRTAWLARQLHILPPGPRGTLSEEVAEVRSLRALAASLFTIGDLVEVTPYITVLGGRSHESGEWWAGRLEAGTSIAEPYVVTLDKPRTGICPMTHREALLRMRRAAP